MASARSRVGRALARAKGTPTPGTPTSAGADPGLLEDDVLDFLYPYSRTDPAARERVRTYLRQCNPVRRLADLRPFLARSEQQTAPSPVVLRFGNDELATYTLDGLTLYALRDDPAVSEVILDGGVYEPHVDATLRTLCKKGDVVIDVGANIGVHTFLMSSLVGPQGSVVALEPNSENCRLIILGMLENNITNVSLQPVALSRGPGWSYFATHFGSNGGLVGDDRSSIADGRGLVVPTMALDDLDLRRPVNLIKMDVEGAEGLVAAGAQRILREDRPTVITELSADMLRRVSGLEIDAYLQTFAGLGYAFFLIERPSGEWTPTTPAQLAGFRADDPFRIDDLLLMPPTGG
jgi:FkbM family methyltransferase